ncbi:DUF397 domain-containing protein [Streptomyces roseifaciens]
MSTELTWFKSSYSGGAAGDCVEVALSWRMSSHSGGAGGNCFEVATLPRAVHVRDSKRPKGSRIAVSAAVWVHFVGFAAGAAAAG